MKILNISYVISPLFPEKVIFHQVREDFNKKNSWKSDIFTIRSYHKEIVTQYSQKLIP